MAHDLMGHPVLYCTVFSYINVFAPFVHLEFKLLVVEGQMRDRVLPTLVERIAAGLKWNTVFIEHNENIDLGTFH